MSNTPFLNASFLNAPRYLQKGEASVVMVRYTDKQDGSSSTELVVAGPKGVVRIALTPAQTGRLTRAGIEKV